MLDHLAMKFYIISSVSLLIAVALLDRKVDSLALKSKDLSEENEETSQDIVPLRWHWNWNKKNEFRCPGLKGRYPHPQDCSKFFRCKFFIPKQKTCPEGKLFDGVKKECKPANEVHCGSRKRPTKDQATTESDQNTTPKNEDQATTESDQNTTPKNDKFRCPGFTGIFPHPQDCSKYFSCIFFIPKRDTCPENKLFDDVKKKCKPANEVDCGSRKRPTSETTEVTIPLTSTASSTVVTPESTTMKVTSLEQTTYEPTTLQPTTPEITLEPTTPEPTTPEPRTLEPTTPEPTTLEPTTPEPRTLEQTTPEPTTLEPTTPEPTTLEPTTPEPTTPEPTTTQPTTLEPTTPEPTTLEPTTPEPMTLEPTTTEPTTLEPTTPEPTTLEPTTPEPTTPEPTTPEPTTPEPTTPEPTTPEPTTPEPTTPEPTTPEPTTLESTTPEPTTPEPTGPPDTDCDEDDIDCIIEKTGGGNPKWFKCPEPVGSYGHPSSNKLFIFCKNWKAYTKKCGHSFIFSEEMRTCISP